MNQLPRGLAGFLAARQQGQQEETAEIQQMGALQQILAGRQQMQQQQAAAAKEAAIQADRAKLGTNPTPEAVMQFALKHSPPKDVLTTQTAHADRQAALAARAAEAQARLEQRQANLDMVHEFRLSRAANEAERLAETARANKAREELQAQNAATMAELRKLGLRSQQERDEERRQRQTQTQVQQLGTALERANLPEADAVLRGVEDAMKKSPNLAEYISGPLSATPDLLVGKLTPGMTEQQVNDIRAGRQAFQKLFNITLKNRSGAAVTNQELERLKQEFATGAFKTAEQLQAAVGQARRIISDHYRSVAAGFGPDALRGYNENLRSTGGTPILEPASAPAAPAPTPTPAPAKFVEGKVYVDAKGNKAKFVGGKFVPEK